MKPKFGTSPPSPPICNTAPPAPGYLAQNLKLFVTELPSPSNETYCTEYRTNVSETESVKHTASILEEFLVAVFYHLSLHPKGTNDIHV